MPTYEDELIRAARELQRCSTKVRRLKRQLKASQTEKRQASKMAKALKQASEQRRPDIAPSRLHGGVTGLILDQPLRLKPTDTPTAGSEYVAMVEEMLEAHTDKA